MQIKVFEAEDMRSALTKVKKALGPDALILSSRSIYKNKFGIGGKPWIEVTAAINDQRESAGGYVADNRRHSEGFGSGQSSGRAPDMPLYNRKGSFKKILKNREPSPDERSPSKERALLQELEEMKELFQNMIQEFSGVKSEWKKQVAPSLTNSESQKLDLDYSGQFLTALYERGVGTEVLQLIAERVNTYPDSLSASDPMAFLERFIAETIRIENPLSEGGGQKRLAFIGPTGVGKTTTVAKIAGNYLLDSSKKVALATVDNHRIAAVEQLKIYGHIMNVPVEVARTPEQLRDIFGRHLDKDLILVDTGGRSPKDPVSRQELVAFLDPVLNIDNHLVLSAAAGQSELLRIIDRFNRLGVSGLILTKLDECDLFGSILNAPVYSGRPLSFLTNGQKVPQDLLLPEPRDLAGRILKPNEVGVHGISDRAGTFRRAARVAS